MPLKDTIFPVLMLLFTACSKPILPEITRLDLAPSDSLSDLRELWHKSVPAYSSETENMFSDIISRDLPPLDSVEAVLSNTFKHENVKFVGVVNPFRSPIVVSDSIIFIGLNHYLGAESQAYKGFPEYIRRTKSISRLPIDVVEEFLMNKFKLDENKEVTTLMLLLYIGAVERQSLQMLPKGTTEAAIIGLTDDEYLWCKQNEQRIWQRLIENKMLYSTDHNIHNKLFRPTPAATVINANAPGNVARYIGLKIAQAYEKATGNIPEPTPEFVFNNQTLIKSKYSPENASR